MSTDAASDKPDEITREEAEAQAGEDGPIEILHPLQSRLPPSVKRQG